MDNLFLRKVERQVRLPEAARAALGDLARQQIRHVAARQDLVGHDTGPHHAHLILDGWACRYRQFPDGRRAIVALLLPGDLCDPYRVHRIRADHAVGALTALTVARLAPEALDEAARAHPAIEACFRREMLAALALQREWTAGVGRRSAIERLAHLFCELHLRLAAVGLVADATFPMPVTQPDLADALGQTSVHINRTLRELRAAGLIELRGRRLTIRDLPGLKALALFDPAYLYWA
ncbi:Crp/Fnr family transcriptional regulator [Methylobacterium sp. NEAU 140]|uniref:Crp/Fnr family transcriptional regulator n=1 Tax=Methylobacterium sp. NEAU 140 TaxID=3064945 RepID=UPI0027332202|nr:Crp/Fnr family transcriptional regulator [Methylobacterium sp. NEAU 140]MDP4024371.1 Crp/Fnr family transcriptional regulator [Methylobacterium sp. NEAU 140]